MKLAILGTRGIPARYGGFETFAEEVATRLVLRGIRVTVYCEDTRGEKLLRYKGVDLVYVPSYKLGPLSTIVFDLFCLWHARKSYDVVYMLGYGASLFCFLPRLWGSRVWINMDGIEWARAKWNVLAKTYFKIMEALAVRISDRVIADAEGIHQFLYDRHSFRTPCSVIPYGARVIEREPERELLHEYGVIPYSYYLVVCRLEPENHVLEIMEGFAASGTDCALIVIGDHKAGTAYVKKLKQVTDSRIVLAGVLYDREKLSALRYYCRAYLHGHSVGGTNPSLLEALGCGNIVIAHDNVFNREVIGETALYFKRSDDIARSIAIADVKGPDKRASLSAASMRRIRERYQWEIVTNQYHAVLTEECRDEKTAPSSPIVNTSVSAAIDLER